MQNQRLTIQGEVKATILRRITETFIVRDLWLIFVESYEKDGKKVEKENTPKFQIVGKAVEKTSDLKAGDFVEISFFLEGRKYEKEGKTGHVTNNVATFVKVIDAPEPAVSSAIEEELKQAGEIDDLPF